MPEASAVPVNVLTWLLALTPLIVLLVLLVVLRWKAAQAGPIGFLAAGAIALLFFRTPIETLAIAAAKGFWDAVFILYIVWTALALYDVAKGANVFEAFRVGVREFTPNRLVQFLAFGLVFVLFLQAAAGFGTPIAVVAPLLIGLGIRPLYAVSLALIGHVWGNSFGSLAISWLAMNLVVPVTEPTMTLVVAGVLLALGVLGSALTLTYAFGGLSALRDGWPLILVLVIIYGLGQLAIAPFVPELAAIVPAAVALGAIYWLGRRPRYQTEMAGDVRREILIESGAGPEVSIEEVERRREAEAQRRARPPLLLGFVPYIALVGFLLVTLTLTQAFPALDALELGFGFPETTTGYGVTREAAEVYSGLNPIRHPGTSVLFAVLLGYAVLHARGYIRREQVPEILRQTAGNALPASVAVIGFLAMSQTMDHSGQIFVLARGIAEVLGPALYSGASVFIGALGAFMTSSNTASNVLFSPLHVQAAQALGINEGIVLGGQMAGGAYGNAVAPANVVLGTGTAQITGQEGAVLRQTLPWTLVVSLLGALVTIGIYLFV